MKAKSRRKLTVRRKPGREQHLGLLDIGNRVIPCQLGKSGMTVLKCEGDGASPVGSFTILHGYFRSDRERKLSSRLGMQPICVDDGWCDDPGSPSYNQFVKLPFRASHEEMYRQDRLYNFCLVMDYNIHPRSRGRGSAIFFHLTNPGGNGTAGCVAISPMEMRRLVPSLSSKTVMRIIP